MINFAIWTLSYAQVNIVFRFTELYILDVFPFSRQCQESFGEHNEFADFI